MKIAAAQIKSTVGDITVNLDCHYKMIEFAAKNGVDLIAFPEMSITGYSRKKGKELAFKKNDERLSKMKALSDHYNILIIAGAPIELDNQLFIGSFIMQPNQAIKIYTKQYLHQGEDEFYHASFDYNPIIKLKNEIISLAICADINNELHPKNAKQHHCTIYIPSIFFSKNGIEEGHEILSKYAKIHSFNILMSNYCQEHWNLTSGGRSAFWNSNGKLINEINIGNIGLLIAEKKTDYWEAKVLEEKEIYNSKNLVYTKRTLNPTR
ncbi:MAG: putative amidohydrolase [Maribacter sp.]|jgi:predicted amidohydrolase